MRLHVLLAGIIAAVLANLLVFGAVSTNLFLPTSLPPPGTPRATFTPNPQLSKRLVTVTNTPSPTPTHYPTTIPLKDPRGPIGRPDDW